MVKLSHNNGLYLLGSLQGFYVPVGADRTADLTSWKAIADRG